MGLNDFVAFFYGSAQNLQTVTAHKRGERVFRVSVSVCPVVLVAYCRIRCKCLKNRKNAKAPKINLNDCSSDVKYGKSLKTPPQLLATLTASGKNANSGCGGGVSGVGSENMTNTGGGKSPANATGSATVTAHRPCNPCNPLWFSVGIHQRIGFVRASGLRKKSSFIWNSFRMPRSKKGESRDSTN
ncbi:unnamed protein product [Ceratitis capitata]|uniref:(Mediterranean fruit fly) hypothetical protein n=1 Tax=Ceratitis capitata TaxID=7213 RepID=A0A811UMA0_CERCA|nr:unnamed protein product [Ceratitis capitata]